MATKRREPRILPLPQEPTPAQALDGEDVGTPVTHHQAAFTGPAHRHRHVGHTYARTQRIAHGRSVQFKTQMVTFLETFIPKSNREKYIFKIPTIPTIGTSPSYSSRVAAWQNTEGGMGRAGSTTGALLVTLGEAWGSLGSSRRSYTPATRTVLRHQHNTQKALRLILYKTLSCSECTMISAKASSYSGWIKGSCRPEFSLASACLQCSVVYTAATSVCALLAQWARNTVVCLYIHIFTDFTCVNNMFLSMMMEMSYVSLRR